MLLGVSLIEWQPPLPSGYRELSAFVDKLLLHIADGTADLIADHATDETHLDPVSGYERTFEVELVGKGVRVVVSCRVLDDRKDFAYVRCIPCGQSGYLYCTVAGSGTTVDITRVIASIRQSLQTRHRSGAPQICSGCGNLISLMQSGLNQYRCKKGHEFVLKAKATTRNPNILWPHELKAMGGNLEGCPLGKTFDDDPDHDVRTIVVNPAPES